jgi:hypothetical protein
MPAWKVSLAWAAISSSRWNARISDLDAILDSVRPRSRRNSFSLAALHPSRELTVITLRTSTQKGVSHFAPKFGPLVIS